MEIHVYGVEGNGGDEVMIGAIIRIICTAFASQAWSGLYRYWLRQHNLRLVQWLAGHKYVSSTQRYQVNNLDDLQN